MLLDFLRSMKGSMCFAEDDDFDGGGGDEPLESPADPDLEGVEVDDEPPAEADPAPAPGPESYDAPDDLMSVFHVPDPAADPRYPGAGPTGPPPAPPGYPQQPTGPQGAPAGPAGFEDPGRPHPDLAVSDPRAYDEQMYQHMRASLAREMMPHLNETRGEVEAMRRAEQFREQDRVASSIQRASHVVSTKAYGKDGLFWRSPVFAGSPKVQAEAKKLMGEHLRNATDYARETYDTTRLDSLESEERLLDILALAARRGGGFDLMNPKPVQMRGASFADPSGPGQQKRMSKRMAAEIREAEEAGYPVDADELSKADARLAQGID